MSYRRMILMLGLSLLVAQRGLGQGQLSSKSELEGPYREYKSRFVALITGAQKATDGDKQVADIYAKWYVHRLTDVALRGDVQGYGKKAADLIREFDDQCINSAMFSGNSKVDQNRAFVDQMGPALVRAIRPVFQDDLLAGDNRMVQITAATMLPRMAKLKQPDIGAYLAELVKDSKIHDAIRLYALKGLKESMPVRYFDDVDIGSKTYEKQRDRDVALIDALVGYVEGNYGGKASEVEPDVIRFLRREALESLGQAGLPAIAAMKRDGQPLAPIAPTMLKVLAKKGGLQPEPGIQEKIEAAIGLCGLRYVFPEAKREMDEYRADLAVYLIGQCIDEFAKKYGTEVAGLGLKGEKHRIPSVAWKMQAKRLEVALDELLTNTRPSQLQKFANEQAKTFKNARDMATAAKEILKEIYAERLVQQQLVPFENLIRGMRPQDKKCFRTVKTSDIEID